VTTNFASVGHGMTVVACAMSTRPVARSTFGQPTRSHASYSHGAASGRCATGMDGNHGSGGR
jgi:hypothetical protein